MGSRTGSVCICWTTCGREWRCRSRCLTCRAICWTAGAPSITGRAPTCATDLQGTSSSASRLWATICRRSPASLSIRIPAPVFCGTERDDHALHFLLPRARDPHAVFPQTAGRLRAGQVRAGVLSESAMSVRAGFGVEEVEGHARALPVCGVGAGAVGGAVGEEGHSARRQFDGHGALLRRVAADMVIAVRVAAVLVDFGE